MIAEPRTLRDPEADFTPLEAYIVSEFMLAGMTQTEEIDIITRLRRDTRNI